VKTPVVESQTPVSATANQMVVRDAASGQLRAATAEEAQTLKPMINARITAPTTLSRVHSSGAQGARLTDEFMSYSIVVRQADGSLAEVCFSTREEAEAALKTPLAKPANTAPTE
jgi:hypothetical protein